MKDENDPKKKENFIVKRPKLKIAMTGGGIGTIGFVGGRMSGVVNEIKFPISPEFVEKIWLAISNNAFAILAIVVCICFTICFIVYLHYKLKLQKETLDKLHPILEDNTISSIKVKTEKGNVKLSALKDTCENEKGPPKKQTNKTGDNILVFRNSDDLEAK